MRQTKTKRSALHCITLPHRTTPQPSYIHACDQFPRTEVSSNRSPDPGAGHETLTPSLSARCDRGSCVSTICSIEWNHDTGNLDSMVSQLLLRPRSQLQTITTLHRRRLYTDDATLRFLTTTPTEREKDVKKIISRYHQTTSLFSPSTSHPHHRRKVVT
jgi:hypothetical protein